MVNKQKMLHSKEKTSKDGQRDTILILVLSCIMGIMGYHDMKQSEDDARIIKHDTLRVFDAHTEHNYDANAYEAYITSFDKSNKQHTDYFNLSDVKHKYISLKETVQGDTIVIKRTYTNNENTNNEFVMNVSRQRRMKNFVQNIKQR